MVASKGIVVNTKGSQTFIIVGKIGKHLVLDLLICLANVVPILIGPSAKENLKISQCLNMSVGVGQ